MKMQTLCDTGVHDYTHVVRIVVEPGISERQVIYLYCTRCADLIEIENLEDD